MVTHEGIVVDTTNRIFLTSTVNSLFLAKSQFMRSSGCIKEKLPIENDEESSLVDKTFEISNLELIRDIESIVKLDDYISIIK